MTRGRASTDPCAAARQLSEPSEFSFASSLSSSSSVSARRRTSTASPARPEQSIEYAQEQSTPPLLELDYTGSPVEAAAPREASLKSASLRGRTVLEQAIERHTAIDASSEDAPELIRWHSYDNSTTTTSEPEEEDCGLLPSCDDLDRSASTTAAPLGYLRLVAPPTPLALPGGWTGPRASSRSTVPSWNLAAEPQSDASGLRWRADRDEGGRRTRRRESVDATDSERDEALILPPPFLTTDSPKESFDGLLGARSARQRSRIARQHERLFAQGRAPPPPFPQNVVKAAVKVARLLGPPAGFDENGRRLGVAPELRRERRKIVRATNPSPRRKGLSLDQAAQLVEQDDPEGRQMERQRRRVRRAESGIKAYEIGARVGRHLAGRLERHRSRREDSAGTDRVTAPNGHTADPVAKALPPDVVITPAHLLGSPPSPVPSEQVEDQQNSLFLSDDGIPPIPPSAPPLRPIKLDDPLPTIATPFQLEGAAMAPDYFGMQHRSEAPIDVGHAASDRYDRGLVGDVVHILPRRPSLKLKRYPRSVSDTGHAVVDWLIWLLVGSPPDPAIAGLDTSIAYVGGVLGGVIHLIAFTFFVGYHASALVVASCVSLRATSVFLYWAVLNLSGRTEVSRSVVDYWRTCRAEWDKVYSEEGETAIGAFSVVRGFFELAVLQSMTRAEWLRDGPGDLVLLNSGDGDLKRTATPRFGPTKRRSSRLHSKPSVTQRLQSFRWNGGADEDEGSGLVLTRAAGGILEGSIISHDVVRSASPPLLQAATAAPRRASLTPASPAKSIEQLLDDEPPGFELDEGEAGSTTPPALPSSPPLLPLSAQEDPLEDFVALVKRYCRLCTASYGLHTMLPSPPTPLLTPSGQTLPHRVFAHLGGLGDHRNVLHVALQKRYDGIPTDEQDEIEAAYAPQFYILRDDYRGEIVCVIRGTQSLADVRTDLDGSLVPLELAPLEGEPPARAASYRVHSSILSAARHLLSPTSSSPLHENLVRILTEHPRYALVFTGHSLGAALASTLALLLGNYDPTQRRWFVAASSSLGNGDAGRPLRAVCFAHPTTLNAPLAERCAVPKQALTRADLDGMSTSRGTPLVVNVSLGADVICRMGIPQVREIRRALGRLDRLRQTSTSGVAKSNEMSEPSIVAAWWRWRKVTNRLAESQETSSTNGSANLDSLERQRSQLERLAWRRRVLAEGWDRARTGDLPEEADVEMAIPAGHCFHLDQLPPNVEAEKRQEHMRARLDERDGNEGGRASEEDDDDQEPMLGFYEVRNPTGFYAMPILSADLLGAHMPKAYLEATQSL